MTAVSPQRLFQTGRSFELSKDPLTVDAFFGDLNSSIESSVPQDPALISLFGAFDEAQIPSHFTCGSPELPYRSREPSVAGPAPAQPRHPTPEKWASIRPVFTKLYITEDKTLKEVRAILERHHKFSATERMYKSRIKAWKLSKNLKKVEKESMIQNAQQGKPISKTLPNGQPYLHRLVRHCKENNISLPALAMNAVSNTPLNSDGRISSGRPELQSLFEPAFQASRPIALYGSIRAVEIAIHNIESYMNSYLTEGHGSHYYKKKFLADTGQGSGNQTFVLVKDVEALRDLLNPCHVAVSMAVAHRTLEAGFVESAFRMLNQALDCVKTLFNQNSPLLICTIFMVLYIPSAQNSEVTRKVRDLVRKMASTLLGSAHPLSIIVNQAITLTSAVEKCHLLCAFSKVITTLSGLLEDHEMISAVDFFYVDLLLSLKSLDEAGYDLESLYGWALSQNDFERLMQKGVLLYNQRKYAESSRLLQRCLEVLRDNEEDLFAAGTDSESIGYFELICNCICFLAHGLEAMGEIEDAKATWRRVFVLACKVQGPDRTEAQMVGLRFDCFLRNYGFYEESGALRAECPLPF